jgi:hypothetical protein
MLRILSEDGDISEDIIAEQLERMKDYFSTRQAKYAVDVNEDIYISMLSLRNAREYLDVLLRKGVAEARMIECGIKHLSNNRIGVEGTAYTLVNKIHHLLKKTGNCWEDWEKANGELGELYLEYEKKHALSEIRRCKAEIWEEGFKRVLESARLHGTLSGDYIFQSLN